MSALNKLMLVGAGGHGRVVADIAEALGYTDISFVDEKFPALKRNLAWNVFAKQVDHAPETCLLAITIGHNATRLQLARMFLKQGFDLPLLAHPTAYISRHSEIAVATVVMPQVVINAGASLGFAVIANTSCSIDHDCVIGDGVHVSPGARLAGGVKVGEGSWIGIGASIRENITIGKNVMIAAGAVVVADVPDDAVVMGVPARVR